MDDELFKQKADEKGLKLSYISEQLGITHEGFIKKRRGIIPFKVREINIITEILGLTASERDRIFGLKCSK